MKTRRCGKEGCKRMITQKNKSGLCYAHIHEKITMDKYWKKKEEGVSPKK